jgi:hypothetical protein
VRDRRAKLQDAYVIGDYNFKAEAVKAFAAAVSEKISKTAVLKQPLPPWVWYFSSLVPVIFRLGVPVVRVLYDSITPLRDRQRKKLITAAIEESAERVL